MCWIFLFPSALMTSPRAERERLMFCASFNRSPVASVLLVRSVKLSYDVMFHLVMIYHNMMMLFDESVLIRPMVLLVKRYVSQYVLFRLHDNLGEPSQRWRHAQTSFKYTQTQTL